MSFSAQPTKVGDSSPPDSPRVNDVAYPASEDESWRSPHRSEHLLPSILRFLLVPVNMPIQIDVSAAKVFIERMVIRVWAKHTLSLVECLAAFFEGGKGPCSHRCYHRGSQGCGFRDRRPFNGQSRDVCRGLQPELTLGPSSNRAYGFDRETTPQEKFDILSERVAECLQGRSVHIGPGVMERQVQESSSGIRIGTGEIMPSKCGNITTPRLPMGT